MTPELNQQASSNGAEIAAEPCAPHRRYLCRHIFADGHRCGSPALRHEPFCYHHHSSRPRKPADGKCRHMDAWEPFELGLIEDRASALLVTAQILRRIASNDLDPTRAGHMIRGLQAIARFLPQETRATTGQGSSETKAAAQPEVVEDLIVDEELGVMAPVAEFVEAEATRESPVAAKGTTGAAAPAKVVKSRGLGFEPVEYPPIKPYSEYSDDEALYLSLCLTVGGDPLMPRPASLSRKDAENHLNAVRQKYGHPPITLAPDADPATLPSLTAAWSPGSPRCRGPVGQNIPGRNRIVENHRGDFHVHKPVRHPRRNHYR